MRLLSSIFILFALLITSCGNQQNEEIEAVLSKREHAFETQDVDLYMSLISPDYNQEKNNKAIGVEEIKKNFLSNVTLFDNLEMSYADRSIYDKAQKTEVVQITIVDVAVNETKSKFKINERIQLSKIDGKWLIVKESDADFLERFVFGGSN